MSLRLRWTLLSALGLALGLTGGIVLVEQVGRALTGGQVHVGALDSATRAGSLLVVGLVSGLFLGASQWFVLRSRPAIARAWLWVSTLGLGAALLAGSLAADFVFGGLTAPAGFVGFVLVAGLIAGGVTSTQAARLADRAAAV